MMGLGRYDVWNYIGSLDEAWYAKGGLSEQLAVYVYAIGTDQSSRHGIAQFRQSQHCSSAAVDIANARDSSQSNLEQQRS
jgi:hypothetical protein